MHLTRRLFRKSTVLYIVGCFRTVRKIDACINRATRTLISVFWTATGVGVVGFPKTVSCGIPCRGRRFSTRETLCRSPSEAALCEKLMTLLRRCFSVYVLCVPCRFLQHAHMLYIVYIESLCVCVCHVRFVTVCIVGEEHIEIILLYIYIYICYMLFTM